MDHQVGRFNQQIRSLGRKTGTALEVEYKVTTAGELW
jgi:hypothetical protein